MHELSLVLVDPNEYSVPEHKAAQQLLIAIVKPHILSQKYH